MVYIVVLNWNGWRDTIACLESLMSLDYASYKIVICDNDSSDDSVEQLIAWYKNNKTKFEYLQGADFSFLEKDQITNYHSLSDKGLYLLQTGKNLGYAGGNNVGLKFALQQEDMEFAWVLNNDTEVEHNSLTELKKTYSIGNVGVVGSKLHYFDDRTKLQGIAGQYNFWTGITKHLITDISNSEELGYESKYTIKYPIGASLMFSKECLNKVGLLSESYFLYYEETDYTLRALEEDFSVQVNPLSVVYHKEGASTGKSVLADYYFVRNKYLISWKYRKITLLSLYLMLPFYFVNRLRRFEFLKAFNCVKAALLFYNKNNL